MLKLLVDSSSDYIPALLEGRQIEYVPLSVTVGGTTYRDGVDLSKDDFYRLLQESEEFPKTALPSPADFAELFEQAKARGDELVCVLLSSALSGTWQSALTAKAMVEYEGIHIVDSRSAAYGIQLLVEEADRLRRLGWGGAQIAARLEVLRGRIRIAAVPDTLEYLCKGGRLSRAEAALGSAVNLKPIITVTPEGAVTVMQKCLGHGRALRALAAFLAKHPADPAFPIYPVYTCGHQNADRLTALLAAEGAELRPLAQVGCTIGAHIGPELYGLIYLEQEPQN